MTSYFMSSGSIFMSQRQVEIHISQWLSVIAKLFIYIYLTRSTEQYTNSFIQYLDHKITEQDLVTNWRSNELVGMFSEFEEEMLSGLYKIELGRALSPMCWWNWLNELTESG